MSRTNVVAAFFVFYSWILFWGITSALYEYSWFWYGFWHNHEQTMSCAWCFEALLVRELLLYKLAKEQRDIFSVLWSLVHWDRSVYLCQNSCSVGRLPFPELVFQTFQVSGRRIGCPVDTEIDSGSAVSVHLTQGQLIFRVMVAETLLCPLVRKDYKRVHQISLCNFFELFWP